MQKPLSFPVLSSRYIYTEYPEIVLTLQELSDRFDRLREKRPTVYPFGLREFIALYIRNGWIRPI